MERYRVYGITAKIEAVSGTDITPDGTNAVRTVGIPELKIGYLEDGDRGDTQTAQLGVPDRAQPAGRFATIDISLEVKGAGAAYAAGTRPECDPFLRAAGFSSTVDATGGAEKVTYYTIDDGMETLTLYCYTARKLIKLIGCVAQLKLSAEANKRGILTFSITGRVASDPTEVNLPALTISSVIPPLFNGATQSIGAFASTSNPPLVLQKVDINDGTAVSPRPSAGATDGHAGYVVTDRKVNQAMDIEVVPLASFDPFTLSKAAPAGLPATTTWQIGTAQYNRLKVATGRWALKAPTGPKNVNGIACWGIAGDLVMGTAPVSNREINFVFD